MDILESLAVTQFSRKLIAPTYLKDIVEHLDYEFIYLNLRYKVKQLGELIREIDDFLV
jgi:hypothetical protein